MIDIKAIEKEARAEVAEEQASKARGLIKAKLREIAAAEKVVANLRGEYATILRDAGAA